MVSLSLCPQFETNLMLNHKVIKLLLQLKSVKAYSKNYIKVKPHLVRHLLRNCLLLFGVNAVLTLSHLGDLVHSQPVGGIRSTLLFPLTRIKPNLVW